MSAASVFMLSLWMTTTGMHATERGPSTLLSSAAQQTSGRQQLPAFSKIQVAGDIHLNLFGGANQRTADVRCHTPDGPGVTFELDGETLMVRPQHEDRRTSDICLAVIHASGVEGLEVAGTVTVRGGMLSELTDARLAGSGSLDLRGLRAPRLALQAAGAGLVKLSGAVDTVTVEVSGAADIQAKYLVAQHGTLKVTGSGSIEATTQASVNAQTAGSGTITVHGQPPKVSQNALGDGEIVIQ